MELELAVGSTTIKVDVVADDDSLHDIIRSKVTTTEGREDKEDPFYVVDLGRLLDLHCEWQAALPSVKPFYAVKCNDDPVLLSTLAAMGLGFDCASKNEIEAVLNLGVTPSRIIYAHTCKPSSHLKYAAEKGVALMTFDNQDELLKTKRIFPTAKLVLRIRADDPDALYKLGMKFGCSVSEGCSLLATARELDLEVVGVSFHVGSSAQSPSAYQSALEMAAKVFLHAASLGFQLTLLDIGGGYPGSRGSREVFQRVASAVRASLEELFSRYPHLTVIAEPGNYFACSTHTLAVNVTSKRRVPLQPDISAPTDSSVQHCENAKTSSFMYYINDGTYGSFYIILYDRFHGVLFQSPFPRVLKAPTSTTAPLYPSSVWGPTCDGGDRICDADLPELDIGEWLFFEDMGSYTLTCSTSFCGFRPPKSCYYIREKEKSSFHTSLRPVVAAHSEPVL